LKLAQFIGFFRRFSPFFDASLFVLVLVLSAAVLVLSEAVLVLSEAVLVLSEAVLVLVLVLEQRRNPL
jgi:hypothetical protein